MATDHPELNAVLGRLVSDVRVILGNNFCGAYLQGSFAIGDADEHSDVDFLVVTDGEVGDVQLLRLQAMHKRLYGLSSPWAQHLEGSYAPKEAIRHIDPERLPFLYLDNGASELIRDSHCNTAVVRWTIREHGVVLAGPDPQTFIDPVSADQLRDEARRRLLDYAEWARTPVVRDAMDRWTQTYLVLTYCRMLHTLEHGAVGSKLTAGAWALSTLDPDWSDLIQRALDDRPNPWDRVHQPADAGLADQTLAFIQYALREAADPRRG